MGNHRASGKRGITIGKLVGTAAAAATMLFVAPAATAFADPLGDLGKAIDSVNQAVRGQTEGANAALRGQTEGFNAALRGQTEGLNGVLRGNTEGSNGILRGTVEGLNKIVRGNIENANLMLRGFFFAP